MRHRFVGSRVVLSAPQDSVVFSALDMPPASSNVPRQKIVDVELARTMGLVPGSFASGWWDMPEAASGGSVGSKVIAAALEHSHSEPLIAALEAVGLHVDKIEPATLALGRIGIALGVDPNMISAIADFGDKAVRLTLLHRGVVVHHRELPDWGLAAITSAVEERLSATPDLARLALWRSGVDADGGGIAQETSRTISAMLSDLVDEISLSFSFVSHQYPEAELGPLLLTGGGASIPQLDESLGRALQIETQIVPATSLVEFPLPPEAPAASTALVPAIGLVLMQEGKR